MYAPSLSRIAGLAWCLGLGAAGLYATPVGFTGVVFNADTYAATIVFGDPLVSTIPMTIAFDGAHYWSAIGGASSPNYAEYESDGNPAPGGSFGVGLDFRSVFSDTSNAIYARAVGDSTIYKQSTPGGFSAYLALAAAGLDPQSQVVLDGTGTHYIARSGSTVSMWDLLGEFVGNTTLTDGPAGTNIAALGSYWFTWDGSGLLSAWSTSGQLLDQTVLHKKTNPTNVIGPQNSLSSANGMLFVESSANFWNGFDLALPVPAPEPSAAVLVLIGAVLIGAGGKALVRRRL